METSNPAYNPLSQPYMHNSNREQMLAQWNSCIIETARQSKEYSQ